MTMITVDVEIDILDHIDALSDDDLIRECKARKLNFGPAFGDAEIDDLSTFVRLAHSDPQSAAVYFHRATGKHLFEVENPCLL